MLAIHTLDIADKHMILLPTAQATHISDIFLQGGGRVSGVTIITRNAPAVGFGPGAGLEAGRKHKVSFEICFGGDNPFRVSPPFLSFTAWRGASMKPFADCKRWRMGKVLVAGAPAASDFSEATTLAVSGYRGSVKCIIAEKIQEIQASATLARGVFQRQTAGPQEIPRERTRRARIIYVCVSSIRAAPNRMRRRGMRGLGKILLAKSSAIG